VNQTISLSANGALSVSHASNIDTFDRQMSYSGKLEEGLSTLGKKKKLKVPCQQMLSSE
jgi:hypothetical protein